MKDHISLSTTPGMEDCAALSDEDYMDNARLEARTYQRQLIRFYGMNPAGTAFRITRCAHDFGTYLDLEFHYDDENQRHVSYMAALDEGCLYWDDKAIHELKHDGYSLLQIVKVKGRRDFEHSNNDGPTGHGDDCYSDADPGL
ncbi:hypothetical protein [Parachryseolinea silvisoli]|uniref:hypothetical protein n=1 Tax=Parachryseolinea silvisoli TaxID=2873601 RepID=UPI0022659F44|nr:hypothetical protein [Parachryseolinea silvisoli]MCD9015214.1 hypothetical protein [Parachryseolinea silvisoli]